jgi:uncharacterized membrane protein
MFIRGEAHPRSLMKAVSWRMVGSIDTFILSFFFTHKLTAAASIASTEVLTKILLYYFHERAWAVMPWGRSRATPQAPMVTGLPSGASTAS